MEVVDREIHLLTELYQGSTIAFDSLYHQYRNAVFANIYKMVKQADLAEDILQEVFLALWEKRHTLHQDKSVAGWLFVVSYNKAMTCLKNKLREAIIFAEQTESLPDMPEDEYSEEVYQVQIALIEEAYGRLPTRKKEVFRLCRFEGKSYEEAAGTLGISVTSVKDYLKQSTKFIRTYIKEGHATTSEWAGISLLLLFLGN